MTTDVQGAGYLLPTVGAAAGVNPTGESSGVSGGGPVTGATTVRSMEELKEKAPEVYNAMLMGIAMRIRAEQEHANDRIKKILRENYKR
jgi:hypothetical protein